MIPSYKKFAGGGKIPPSTTIVAKRDAAKLIRTPIKPPTSEEIEADKRDNYYRPPIKPEYSSGDWSQDFIYNHPWLMKAPVIGNIIKDKAYEIARKSRGNNTIDNVSKALKDTSNYSGKALYINEDGDFTGSQDKNANTSINLVDQYFGKSTLPTSKYKPSSDYLEFLPSYSIKGDFDKRRLKGYDMTSVLQDVAGKKVPEQVNDIDFSKTIYKQNKEASTLSDILGVDLGDHRTGVAFDKEKNLPYVSISDAWDFEPDSYSRRGGTDAKGRAYVQASLMQQAGKPFKIYDRFYFDPKTHQYIPDDKLPQKKVASPSIPKYAMGGEINMMYKRPLRKYAYGGVDTTTYNSYDNPNFTDKVDSYGKAANFTADTMQNISPGSGFSAIGGGALKGAASGAAIGTSIYPGIGTLIGAGVGLIAGIFGGSAKHNAEMRAKKMQLDALNNANAQRQATFDKTALATYNTSGNPTEVGYYKYGGMMSRYKGVMIPLREDDPMNIRSMITPKYYPYKHYALGGDLTDGGGKRKVNPPIVVNNPNDPRYRMYRDSLTVFNGTNRVDALIKHNPMLSAVDITPNYVNSAANRLVSANKAPLLPAYTNSYIGHQGSKTVSNKIIHIQHPTQPVIYQQPTATTQQPQQLITEHSNGSIGPWGNPISPNPITPSATIPPILPSDKSLGYSSTYYNSNTQMRNRTPNTIPSTSGRYRYGGAVSPYRAGNVIYADGGTIPLASDMQQFQGPSHEQGGIPIDTTGNGQANAEVEGNEVQKGNQIFSDRLAPSPQMLMLLKQNKVRTYGTYAEIAAKLGKDKGKYEAKLLSHSPVALRTGKAMHDRNEQIMQALFQDQEMTKPVQAPQMAFGGTIPMYADGGTIDDPRNKARTEALQKQLAEFDKHVADMEAQSRASNISNAKKQQLQNHIQGLKDYRNQLTKGIDQFTNKYNSKVNELDRSIKNYPNRSFSDKVFGTYRDPHDVNTEVKNYSGLIDNGLEMLKRLQTVDPNSEDMNKAFTTAGLKPSSGGEYRTWGQDYYPLALNGKPTNTPVAPKAPPVATTPATPPSHTPPVTESTPMVKRGARATTYRPNIARQPAITLNAPTPNLGSTALPTIAASTPTQPIVAAPKGESGISKVGNFLNDYGADIINTATYFGNQSRINKMQAPTFSYLPAPSFNYNDRSGLAKYENNVAAKSAMQGVVNTSAQGQTAQKAQIFAQQLNGNNQINNQENLRRDAYTDSYNNRALQTMYTNTDIANRQADVTTQVGNEKIALGIQNQNAFNQGEITNQATRDQNNLDMQKAMITMASTQDPAKLTEYLKTVTDPVMRQRIRSLMRTR